MRIRPHFCSACHNFDSDAERSLSKRKMKYQGFHIQKLWHRAAARKDTLDTTVGKPQSFNEATSHCRLWNGCGEGEHQRQLFGIECGQTDSLQPATMRALTKRLPAANTTAQPFLPRGLGEEDSLLQQLILKTRFLSHPSP